MSDTLHSEYVQGRDVKREKEALDWLRQQPDPVEQSQQPEQPGEDLSILTPIKNTIRDAAGVVVKFGGGVIKGATLDVVDPASGKVNKPLGGESNAGGIGASIGGMGEEGTQKVPETGGPTPLAEFAEPLSKSLKDLGVSADIADNPYIDMVGQAVGMAAPWSLATRTVRTITDAVRIGRNLPAAGKVIPTLETWWDKVASASRTVFEQGVVGAGVVGAQNMTHGEDFLESVTSGAALGSGMQAGLEIARGAATLAARRYGLGPYGPSAAMDALARGLDDLAEWAYRTGKAPTRAEAERMAAAFMGSEINARGGIQGLKRSDVGKIQRDISKVKEKTPGAETVAKDVTPEAAAQPQPQPVTPVQADKIQRVQQPHKLPYGWQSPKQITENIPKRNWVIVTAENPSGTPLIQGGNPALIQKLLSEGFTEDQIHPLDGLFEGAKENAFLIDGMTAEEALPYISDFGQTAAATNIGMLYGDNTINPILEEIHFGEAATRQAGYSILHGEDGDIPFSISYDFSKQIPIPTSELVSQELSQTPIVALRDEAARLEQSLPPVQEGQVRLWRGNRPDEIGEATSFTNDLPGIALPFKNAYGGPLSYVDVPATDLAKYENKVGTAQGAEFNLPSDLANQAREVAGLDKPSEFESTIGDIDKKIEATKAEIAQFLDEVPQEVRTDPATGKTFKRDAIQEDDPRIMERDFKQLSQLDPEELQKISTVPSPTGGRGGVVDKKSKKIVWRGSHGEAQEAVRKQGGEVGDLVFDVDTPAGRKVLSINQFDLLTNPSRAAELSKGQGETRMQVEQAFANLDKLMEERSGAILKEIREKGPTSKSFLDRIDESADKARQRLAERFKGKVLDVTSVPKEGLATIRDLTTIGVSIMARGIRNPRDFAKKLQAAVGIKVDSKKLEKVQRDAAKRLQTLSDTTWKGELSSVEQLLEMFQAGQYGGKWYNNAFEEITKFVGGDTAEARRFARVIAASSQQMNPRRNIKIALDIWWAHKSGTEDFLDKAIKQHPYPAAAENVRRALRDEPFGDKSYKVRNFAENLMGNLDVVTFDIGMKSAFGIPTKKSLSETQHMALEQIIKDIANDAGVKPAEMQAAIWAADRINTEGRNITVAGGEDQYKADIGQNFDEIFRSELEAWKQKLDHRGWPKLGEQGYIDSFLNATLARILIGGVIGGSEGDSIEERIQNAILGGAAGAVAPSVLRVIGKNAARFFSQKKNIKTVKDIMERTGLDEDIARTFDPRLARTPAVPPPARVQAAASVSPTQAATQGAGQQAGSVGTTPPQPAAPPAKAPELFKVVKGDDIKAMMDLDPTTIDLGDKALKINFDQVASHEHVERIMKYLTTQNAARIEAARRGKISVPKMKELARKSGVNFDTIMARRRGQALNAEETQAFIDLLGASLKETGDVIDDLVKNPGNSQLEAKLEHQLNVVSMIHEQVMGARAEWGRAGHAWGTDAQGYIQVSNRLASTMGTLGFSPGAQESRLTKITPTRLAFLMKDTLKSAKDMSAFVDKATRPSKTDMILEAMYGSMLSSPATLSVNAIGSAITTMWAVPERFLAAGVGSAIKTIEDGGLMAPSADHVTFSEAAALAFGMSNSISQAIQIAGHAFKTGERSMAGTKIELSPDDAITAENLGKSGPLGYMIDLLGKAIRTPLRGMLATDEFFKVINASGELWAQGYRRAGAQGLEGDEFAKSVIEYFKELPPEAIEQSREFAAYQTFTNKLGKTGSLAQMGIDSLPAKYKIPVKFFVPFVSTPTNIFKYSAKRTPLALLHQSFLDDMNAGGGRRDLAIAQLSLGSALLLTAGYLTLQGKIKGHRSPDRALGEIEKMMGLQEYFIQIGDTQIAFNRVDPLGMILGLGADWASWVYGVERKGFDPEELFLHGVLPIAWNLTSKTYLEGAVRLLSAVTADAAGDVQNLLHGQGTALVPGFIRQIQRTGIFNDKHFKDARSIWDRALAQIPGASDKVKPDRDVFGHPIKRPGSLGPDLISGIAVSKKREEPHYRALLDNEIGLTPPGRTIFGTQEAIMAREPDPDEGIELSEDQYERLQILAGHDKLGSDKSFEQTIQSLIKTAEWNSLSKYGRQELVQKIHAFFKRAARIKLLEGDKDLQRKVQQKLDERLLKQLK